MTPTPAATPSNSAGHAFRIAGAEVPPLSSSVSSSTATMAPTAGPTTYWTICQTFLLLATSLAPAHHIRHVAARSAHTVRGLRLPFLNKRLATSGQAACPVTGPSGRSPVQRNIVRHRQHRVGCRHEACFRSRRGGAAAGRRGLYRNGDRRRRYGADGTGDDHPRSTPTPETPETTTPSTGCPADAETWRGLRVCSERPREGYDRDDYGTGYSRLEDDIIAALPATMKANGQVYTPYSCIAFDITSSGTAATDIEHIVALAEAHDSGIAADRRRAFAADLDNLTIADPTVNRSQKGARDAAEWMPARHQAWFAERVIEVKREYGLTIDPAERDALETLLASGGAQLNCVG